MTAVALRARDASLSLARAVPVWAWLTGIVVVSAVVRFLLARRIVAPWIMVDELIYSELAKSFAASGHLLVRGESSAAYGFVYPVLIAPAWRLFTSVPDAYAAAKVVNSVLMSLAAVPAYLLARRVVGPGLAVVSAALALLVPSMAYTGTLMTENAFYPAFLLVAYALVLVLERPTTARQLALLALCALAFLIRAQAVALLPAVLSAPFLYAWLGGRRSSLREYRVLWGAAALALLLPLLQVVRGRSALSVFGAYEQAGKAGYTVGGVLKWLLYHVAELDLYVGVVPFAAYVVLLALGRRLPRRAQAFVAASSALAFWLTLEVAAFASKNPVPPRVEERNLFYVAPFLLIALLYWIDSGMPRRHVSAAVAAVLAAALPAVLPYASLIGVPATSDELTLVFWWRLQDGTIALDDVALWATLGAVAAALAFLLVPRRTVVVLPAIVVAWFVAVSWTVNADVHGFRGAAVGALFQGITHGDRDWVDNAVGPDAHVAVLWTTCGSGKCGEPQSLTDAKVVWENEFFSRSVGTVYVLHDPLPGGLPERRAEFHPRSGLFTWRGRPIRAEYLLTDASVDVPGRIVAEDRKKGIFLYRLEGPLRRATEIRGLYADTWSSPRVTYSRRGCVGGRLDVALQSDGSLFRRTQVVTARSFGRVVGRAQVPPSYSQMLHVPLRPRGGRCEVELDVSPTRVPGSGDLRKLGVHMKIDFVQPPPAA